PLLGAAYEALAAIDKWRRRPCRRFCLRQHFTSPCAALRLGTRLLLPLECPGNALKWCTPSLLLCVLCVLCKLCVNPFSDSKNAHIPKGDPREIAMQNPRHFFLFRIQLATLDQVAFLEDKFGEWKPVSRGAGIAWPCFYSLFLLYAFTNRSGFLFL